jgi:hypothetical protein
MTRPAHIMSFPRRRGAALTILFAAGSCGAPPAPPLEPEDFTLAGVPLDADTTEIRLSFGDPDSATVGDNPFDAEVPLVVWYYPAFEARFSGARAVGYMVTGGEEATLRGIRIGDPVDRVLRAYGAPTVEQPSRWTWAESDPELGLRVVDFVIEDDVVTRVYVGEAVR